MIKTILKKIIPERFLLLYHKVLAYVAAFLYGHPSKKMIVIGVTGTSGKSTVVNLIASILEAAGYRCGLTTTFNFKIGNKEIVNTMRMTMPGRFKLQNLLKQMYRAGCEYVIIETTSQGIVQFRHIGINYDMAVFTNLSPEHIESHGSFEKYRQAKEELFKHLTKKKNKVINGKEIKKIIVVNSDDENYEHFLKYEADEKYVYGIKNDELRIKNYENIKIITAKDVKSTSNGSSFIIHHSSFIIGLLGKFNVYNALASISVALSQGIDLSTCQKALEGIQNMPGRMEVVVHEPLVIVDQAHTADSLEKVYKTLQATSYKLQATNLICVFGAAGGGRDKWKRPELGRVAQKYCDYMIVTNEDPYDEDPRAIINEVVSGIKDSKRLIEQKKLFIILDREEAIGKALDIAQKHDIIVITGKGAEQSIVIKGKKIPWSDKKVVKKCSKN
ncbi:UDP-N-acetylmuramoyl-L-alanyl-D-glutamate--2,6-diaminopimelate ligase [Patescibacteria group bacterium AH-259-L07]|nr:UDP-N-acetylmuramoyl-L-alanyl-D-glutamate--2,6-diaminopimelate ligase [Patescibacteria group bacterium AH-259-L07]